MPAASILSLRNADVVFDGVVQVLRSLSLEVRAGQIVALLGGNGAGKTTTLKAVSSLLEPERGRVVSGQVMLGHDDTMVDITNADPCEVVRRGVVQVMEGRRVLKYLTVDQNLRVGGHFRADRGETQADLDRVYESFPQLARLKSRTAGFLSGGEMQQLLLARALMARPKLLLLDEPSMGLAPRIVHELLEQVLRVRGEQNVSVLLVEQNARAALRIADHGYVMETGRIVLHGSGDELENNEDIREFYLGLGSGQDKRSYREVKHYKRRKPWLG